MLSKKHLRLIVILLFPLQSFSQDITGVWKGEFYVDSTKKTYPFELSISENNGKLTGYSRISFEQDGVKQVVFRGHTIKKDGDNYIIDDEKQLAQASSISQPKEVKKTMIVSLIIQDSILILKGEWSTNKTKRFLAARGTVAIQRKNDFRQTEIFKKLDELNLTKALSFNQPGEKPDIVLLPKTVIVQPAKNMVQKSTNTVKAISPTKIAINIPAPEKPKLIVPAQPESKPIVKTQAVVAIKPDAQPVSKPKEAVAIKPTTVTPKVPLPVVVAAVNKPLKAAPAIVAQKPTPIQSIKAVVSKNAALEVDKRVNSSIQSLYYQSDSLQLTLYDNGEIDGDTVSVLLNGKIIIARYGLSLKPNIYTLYFDKNTPDSMMLVMYAENLGSIPPNTGLLVVRDGKSIFELRFSADLSNNAAIILRRRKRE